MDSINSKTKSITNIIVCSTKEPLSRFDLEITVYPGETLFGTDFVFSTVAR